MNAHRHFPLLVVVAALLSGCASGNTDLLRSGYLSVEPTLTSTLVYAPEVSQSGGNLIVAGRVEGRSGSLGGHVEVTVVAPDGKMFYGAQVNYGDGAVPLNGATGPIEGSFHRVQTRYRVYAAYSVQFPGLPPQRSVVRVQHVAASQPPSPGR